MTFEPAGPSLARLSIGLRGSQGAATIARVGRLAEELGFRGVWVSDSPEGDALDALDELAAVTSTLRLGVGVLPLDRRPPAAILPRLHALPTRRLTLGVGAGAPDNALARVRDGVRELRTESSVEVAVGALGPLMRRLAAREASAVVFNWLTPAVLAEVADDLARDSAGRSVRSVLYLRTIVDQDARPALLAEVARKAGRSTYAANLAALDGDPLAAALDGTSELGARLRSFSDLVDEPVLRLVVAESSEPSLCRAVERIAGQIAG